ncbi:MAG: hypothetical protein DMF53_13115 [Acidobacteria bacterium]|nr:MAG: hypothetical protein DMF53_13115 [Acidobacteriota bacterium]
MADTPYSEIRYNQVRQKSSHNSFQREEGIYDQMLYWRLRSLEFDLHNGKGLSPSLTGNWYIYHTYTVDEETSVDKLSDLMTILQGLDRAVPEHEITTIFLDLKDDFDDTHTPEQLDTLLLNSLGSGKILKPADVAPTNDLQAGVASGWPHLQSLRGKFVFVLTGGSLSDENSKLNYYVADGDDARARTCFIAPKIATKEDITAHSYVIFFNLETDQASTLAPEIFSAGFVSRAYVANSETVFDDMKADQVHHIATDKVNSAVDLWSRTDNAKGWPFEGIEITVSESQTEPGVVYGVAAASEDLWGDEDSFYFFYGNGGTADRTWITFISSPDSHVEDYAKGSLMARVSTDSDSAYFAVVRPGQDHGLRIQYRPKAGDKTKELEEPVATEHTVANDTLGFAKISISKSGKYAEGWGSVDGASWVFLGSYSFSDPLQLQGFGTSSHDKDEKVKFLFFQVQQPFAPSSRTAIGDDVSETEAFQGIYP